MLLSLLWTSGWAYALAALIMMAVPLALAAAMWPGERRRDTLESLVLTAQDHAQLAWGRYWHIVLPWLRFLAWMLPLYVLLGVAWTYRSENDLTGGALFSFAPKPVSLAAQAASGLGFRAYPSDPAAVLGVFLGLLRMFRDGLGVMLIAALAYYISVRRIGSTRALLTTCLAVPFLLATIFSLPEWVFFYRLAFAEPPMGRAIERFGGMYLLCSLAAVALEIWIIRRAVGFVARNFDAWALGEKPDP